MNYNIPGELTEVEKLQAMFDACEAANLKHLKRISDLEDACIRLYTAVEVLGEGNPHLAGVLVTTGRKLLGELGLDIPKVGE